MSHSAGAKLKKIFNLNKLKQMKTFSLIFTINTKGLPAKVFILHISLLNELAKPFVDYEKLSMH